MTVAFIGSGERDWKKESRQTSKLKLYLNQNLDAKCNALFSVTFSILFKLKEESEVALYSCMPTPKPNVKARPLKIPIIAT